MTYHNDTSEMCICSFLEIEFSKEAVPFGILCCLVILPFWNASPAQISIEPLLKLVTSILISKRHMSRPLHSVCAMRFHRIPCGKEIAGYGMAGTHVLIHTLSFVCSGVHGINH